MNRFRSLLKGKPRQEAQNENAGARPKDQTPGRVSDNAITSVSATPVRPNNHLPSRGSQNAITSASTPPASQTGASSKQTKVVSQATLLPSYSPFQSLVVRSIAAWNSLNYVGDATQKTSDLVRYPKILRSFKTVEDLIRSPHAFWLFQTRKSFESDGYFLKCNLEKLDPYILLPAADGFINKRDCFFVTHIWRRENIPDYFGVDHKATRAALSAYSWSYVWIDWTCLPQQPRSEVENIYFQKMLYRTPKIMRDCDWTYSVPADTPRLWVLFEVAQVWFSGAIPFTNAAQEHNPYMRSFYSDVERMMTDGVGKAIHSRKYKAANKRDTWLLIGLLELLVILSTLVKDRDERRRLLDSLDQGSIGTAQDYDMGIAVDKKNGIISYKGAILRFSPTFNLPEHIDSEDALPRPPACIDKVMQLLKSPKLNETAARLSACEKTFGPDHEQTLALTEKLAQVFIDLRQYPEAEELRRRVSTGFEKTLGLHHAKTLDSLNNMSAVLHMQQRFEDGAVYFNKYLTGLSNSQSRGAPR